MHDNGMSSDLHLSQGRISRHYPALGEGYAMKGRPSVIYVREILETDEQTGVSD